MGHSKVGFDPAAERLRLEECSLEPIRTPGTIQSHGLLLGVDAVTGFITLASENVAELLATHISELGSEQLTASVESADPVDPIRVEVLGTAYDAIVHRLDNSAIIELEPAITSLDYARTSVVGAIHRLAGITNAAKLRAAAADEIRKITGFDRVMVYHFYEDEHGEVIAESRVPEMEPYLGLHFPASDIPTQARELYVTKLSRAIVSTEDEGSRILALDESAAGIDLSKAELRSVSPFHLQFMRNMGQASTVSFSLVSEGRLHGMITCAHGTERRLPVLLRRALEVLATQLSLQLVAIDRIESLTHEIQVREQRSALLAPLFAAKDVAGTLLDGPETVLDLVPADGVAIRINGVVRYAGDVPTSRNLHAVLAAAGNTAIISDSIARDHPELAPIMPGFAGLLVIPLKSDHDTVVFFRREVTRVVSWLGDLHPENRADVLSPRLSFSAWRQSVSGTALAWGRVAAEADDLAHELEGALMRRAEAQLASLAMRDSLTGLYNRRALLERLGVASGIAPGRALLFIDLDDFKRINDTLGHEAGDEVIVEVGRRLVAGARLEDLVVRLGGDEFVVMCDSLDREEALAIADRLVAAIAAPVALARGFVTVTASCGVVVSPEGVASTNLLEQADRAMYRAKSDGRNRVAE